MIELLAIIVILAIIAVITVPIILNVIDNSKRGAAIDSAYGYKDAVNKFYVTKLSSDPTYNIPDGNYTAEQLKSMGLSISGKEPANNSLLTITKNGISAGCLQFDEYKVEIRDGKVGNAENGECKIVSVQYTDSDSSGDISLGDFIKLGGDGFWVIAPPKDGKVKLLTQYTLNLDSRQFVCDYEDCVYVRFSGENYWNNNLSKYSKDTYDYAYVYRDKDNNDTDNDLKTYVNNYKNYLVNDLGINGISDVRLMSYEEAVDAGCSTTANSCPEYIGNHFFWLGSSSSVDGYIWYVNGYVHYLYDISYTSTGRIRPLIIISESSLGVN